MPLRRSPPPAGRALVPAGHPFARCLASDAVAARERVRAQRIAAGVELVERAPHRGRMVDAHATVREDLGYLGPIVLSTDRRAGKA